MGVLQKVTRPWAEMERVCSARLNTEPGWCCEALRRACDWDVNGRRRGGASPQAELGLV